MMLALMPYSDLVLIHFLLKPREIFTHCTDFSSHTSARSLLLSGRPNDSHLSSASRVGQVPLEVCHLSIYLGGGEAEAEPAG